MQALLQAHDVIAHDVLTDDRPLTPPMTQQQHQQLVYMPNGDGGRLAASDMNGGAPYNGTVTFDMDQVTRVRLVQFQKNTDEPMVS